MKLEVFFNNIEKLLRYLVPSTVLAILLRFFEPESYEKYFSTINSVEFVFYFILSGITIYSIHRVIFEIIDYFLFRRNIEKISEHILESFKDDKKEDLKDYLYYKMATIHSALLTSELAIIFFLIDGFSAHPYLLIISLILFAISLRVYFIYHKIQKKIVKGTFPKAN